MLACLDQNVHLVYLGAIRASGWLAQKQTARQKKSNTTTEEDDCE